MLKKIIEITFSLVLRITITSILFTVGLSADAATAGFTPPDNYRKENSLSINDEPSNEKALKEELKEEIGIEDIFGSEQIFPFEMGLGNSAF